MVSAAARPVFDFDGALSAAKKLYALADQCSELASTRGTAGSNVSDTWKGVHGDSFRERTGTEDASLANVVSNLQGEGDAWAQAWVRAVDIMNDVLYAEAADALAAAEQDQGFVDEVTTGFTNLLFGSDESSLYGRVPKPRDAELPGSTEFVPPSPPFAKYSIDGDSVEVSYVSDVPAPI